MPPSQLKRLKASLREAGVTGPQKSKKQKRNAQTSNDRIERNARLQDVRDAFNPFELRAPSSRPSKQDTINGNTIGKARYKDVLLRPGVSKSVGEDMRRAKLLPEMQRRHKVGGVVDRRIGEGDARMTAEERALERVAAGFKMKGSKAKNIFDLEDSDGGEDLEAASELRHGGRSLADLPADDFNEDLSDDDLGQLMSRKRKRPGSPPDSQKEGDESAGSDQELDEPEVKKSKKEVMQEVIAKSKLHKYERQKAKEDDDDLRDQLDNDMSDLLSLLRNHKPPQQASRVASQPTEPARDGDAPFMNPDRQQLLNGADRVNVDREYDVRLKQMAQEAKAKPSERSKTADEKAKEEAERLRELEERRLKRMRGEEVDEPAEKKEDASLVNDDYEDAEDEAAEFGFTAADALNHAQEKDALVLDDEDEFALDEDLVASGSDLDISAQSESDSDGEDQAVDALEEEEDEFVKGILGDMPQTNGHSKETRLSYTYPCPRSHAELLAVIKDAEVSQLPTIIQRIRALHHPSLNATNKESIADFSAALVEHLSYMGFQNQPLHVTEQVIRHLHSLSRTYPERIAQAFRAQLSNVQKRNDIHAGDLVIFTAIGSIYPTSDHWHQVVTPTMTTMARWLEMNTLDTKQDLKGAFIVALCLKYQHFSKRVVPEALRFTIHALSQKRQSVDLGQTHVQNLLAMADIWKDKSAFIEMFKAALPTLKQAGAKKEYQTLQILLQQARINRRPLELHHHRPLPIRLSIPKFEEGFHPDKHYDPDKERSESKKLLNEYKRERKGAVRELRKDANFIAREQLREKRERDAEYEKKYRRLIAEVQGEAGHDAKEYEKEKRGRKRKQ